MPPRKRRTVAEVKEALEAVNVEKLDRPFDGFVCRCRDCGRKFSKVSYGEAHTECPARAASHERHNRPDRATSGEDAEMVDVEEGGDLQVWGLMKHKMQLVVF